MIAIEPLEFVWIEHFQYIFIFFRKWRKNIKNQTSSHGLIQSILNRSLLSQLHSFKHDLDREGSRICV